MIDADGLWELVEARAQQSPEALFAVDEAGRRLDFAGYRAAARGCAAGLHERGIGPGSRVSWMLPTWLESLVLVAALARLGALQNPILPIYRHRELRFIAKQAKPDLLVVPQEWRGFDYAAMAREIAAEVEGLEVAVADRGLPEGEASGLPPAPSVPADEPRWLFYTSGTTSEPKGALHVDAGLAASGRSLCERLALDADDRIALVFPLTHIGGIGWLFAGLMAGAAQIVVEAFDPRRCIPVLTEHGVTQATAGTVFHQAYLAAQRAQPETPLFPRVRAFPGGGAPKPPALHHEIRQELGGSGIVSGYGMTECPIASMNRSGDRDDRLAESEGRAGRGVSLRIVDAEERLLPPGEEGEIRVHGPQLFRGYLDAELNRAAFDAEGHFRTGDLGRLDAEGYLQVTGRLKDVIIRKGENISAQEVEDLLYRHPKVREATVVGLPDPALGERCCAVVVCEAEAEPLAFEEMVAFLEAQQLMRQKIPEQLELLPELPRNATGKVLKQALRERFARS